MTITTMDKLIDTRRILKQQQNMLKGSREQLFSCKASDVIWVRNRYTELIMDLNIRISALDQEIANEEAAERIREARNGRYQKRNAGGLPEDLPGRREAVRNREFTRDECETGVRDSA